MSKGTTACLSTSIVACVLGILGLSLPYWFSKRTDQFTEHGGLWRNCSVFTDTFRCQTVETDETWFHLVQSFVVIGVAGQLLTVCLGCLYQRMAYTPRVARPYALLSLLSGLFLAAAVILYVINNRQYRQYFNGAFYLAMMASFLSLLNTVMSWFVNMHERRSTLTGYMPIGL